MSLSKRLSGESQDSQGASYPNIGDNREKISPKLAKENYDQEIIKQKVYEELFAAFGVELYSGVINSNELEKRLHDTLTSVIESEKLNLVTFERASLLQSISDEILGLGPIQSFIRDTSVTEIMVNGYKNIYIERSGKITKTAKKFQSEEHLRRTIERIVSLVNRRIDESSPMVDARLLDGTRVNAVVPPIAIDGSTLTLRKFSSEPLTIKDLISFGTLTPESKDILMQIISSRLNVVVSGGTGSGKTTLLNVLSSFIDSDSRIVTIEDAAELRLPQIHVVRLESRPPNAEGKGSVSIRDLVRNSLRMRPDRIIVGEVRDSAALDMLQAMNTGHDGSLTTVHANTPKDALARIETMVLMAGMDLPVSVIREQIASAVDIIIQQSRMADGSRKITHITEVAGFDSGVIQMQDLFVFDPQTNFETPGKGHLVSTGIPLRRTRTPGH
jgi:pilus assembly protein CpaF